MRAPAAIACVVGLLWGLGCGGPDKGTNQPCGDGDECASGICHRQICAVKEGGAFGADCEGDGDCASFHCSEGLCLRGEQVDDAPCRDDAECLSMQCSVEGRCLLVGECGDGAREGSEACDLADLGGKRCGDLGFDAGELGCDTMCHFDTTACVEQSWVRIEAGSLMMGSALDDPEHVANETPHPVVLTRAFSISTTEVTQRQFRLVRRYAPSSFHAEGVCASEECPVESVNWNEAAAYCNALSEQQDLEPCYSCESAGKTVRCETSAAWRADIHACEGYRLPTEAEWELAYRAGSLGAYYQDLDPLQIGWSQGNGATSPQPVEGKTPNAWGLYDLAGNVWEWCHDWYAEDLGSAEQIDPSGPSSGDGRVTRGGSWRFEAYRTRAAARLFNRQESRLYDVGFRCVRTLR